MAYVLLVMIANPRSLAMHRVTSDPPASSRNPEQLHQRRANRRRELDAVVEVLHPREGRGVTINASDGGLRVAVDCALRKGESCLLRISEPCGEPRLEQAHVVWSKELPDGWIAGLRIVGLH
jgi:hypothetical protein